MTGLAAQAAAAAPPGWLMLIGGLFGGGTLVGLATLFANRGTTRANEAATLVTASGQVVELSTDLLTTYVEEMGKLRERVAYLEGRLEKHDAENRFLRAYNAQLIELLRTMNIPVPHPVSVEEVEG